MKSAVMISAALAAALPPPPAQSETTFQLVRPGDAAMSCEALASEINLLAAQAAPAVTVTPEQPPKKMRGLGFLGRALASAAPMLGGGMAGSAGVVVAQVAGAAQAASMQSQVEEQTELANRAAQQAFEAMSPSLATQRKERLMALFSEKRC